MIYQLKKILFLLFFVGIAVNLSSCVVVRSKEDQQRTKIVLFKHKKSHPHGGPPGQTKKTKGHPGKRH